MTHRPSGSMCINCKHVTRPAGCIHLHFDTMRPIKKDTDGMIVVLCVDYARKG